MAIKARRLKENEIPDRTALYEVRNSRNIVVEEKQDDGSVDQVTLEYCVEDGTVGYFAKEYRPPDVQKEGSKKIDITAVMMDHTEKSARWHLYDIKDTLAGVHTIITLYDQWNAALQYIQQNILNHIAAYSCTPDLGVITRYYDEGRMKHLRDEYQKICSEMENDGKGMTLLQRKKRTDIAKYRGTLKAAQSILDREFRAENGNGTYEIHIRELDTENGQVYQMRFSV